MELIKKIGGNSKANGRQGEDNSRGKDSKCGFGYGKVTLMRKSRPILRQKRGLANLKTFPMQSLRLGSATF